MVMSRAKRAFTLIELLVVIAIIAILAAMLFPVYAQAKLSAMKATSISNAKQLMLGVIMYAADYDDTSPRALYLPPNYTWPQPIGWRDVDNMALVLDPYTKAGRGCGPMGESNGGSLWWDAADPQKGQQYMWGSYITNGVMTGFGRSLTSIENPSATIFSGLRAKNWSQVVDVIPPSNPTPNDKFWRSEFYNMATMPWFDASGGEEAVTSPYTFGNGRAAPTCAIAPNDPYCVNWDVRLDTSRYSNQAVYSFVDGHAATKNFASTFRDGGSDNLWDAF